MITVRDGKGGRRAGVHIIISESLVARYPAKVIINDVRDLTIRVTCYRGIELQILLHAFNISRLEGAVSFEDRLPGMQPESRPPTSYLRFSSRVIRSTRV